MADLPPDSAPLAPASGEPERTAGYFANSRCLFNAIVLATPLFVAYQVGVLFTDGWKNGLDFVTPRLYALVGQSRGLYLTVNIAILAVLLVAGRLVRGPQRLRVQTWLLVLLESAFYASVLGTTIVWVMELVGLDPRLAVELSSADELVLSLGAGAYEELVFRLLLLTGLVFVVRRIGLKPVPGLMLAFVVSAVVFSAAHHPPLGIEPWTLGAFVYRFVAGLLFAGLFLGRGFAVAAYSHAFYDVLVLVLH